MKRKKDGIARLKDKGIVLIHVSINDTRPVVLQVCIHVEIKINLIIKKSNNKA
jgi:hypothetical protein